MHYKKYVEYKTQYLSLKNDYKLHIGGTNTDKFACDEKKKFAEICYETPNGIYKSKNSCINDCENKYINYQLMISNLKRETSKFYQFIKTLLDKKYDIYVKGGVVIGLKILKMLYEKYPNEKFDKYFMDFVNLDLIRDWDFACYTNDSSLSNDAKFNKEMDKIASNFGMVRRGGKSLRLYQQKRPIMINKTDALFELAVWDQDVITNMEMPLTTMKIKINQYNLKYIFMFAKSFYTFKTTGEQIDLDIIKRMIPKINIIIDPHNNGFYAFPNKSFDDGGLSKPLLDIIKSYKKYDERLPQFLVTHIKEPNRLVFRLLEKNIPKTKKIIKFIKEHDLPKNQKWLLDLDLIEKVIKNITNDIGKHISSIYKNKSNEIQSKWKLIEPFINDNSDLTSESTDTQYTKYLNDYIDVVLSTIKQIETFFDCVCLARIELNYNDIKDDGKELIKNMFKPLNDQIDAFTLQKLPNDIQTVKLLKFLNKELLFS